MDYAIETEGLILRPFALSDAPEVKRLVGDREVSSTLPVGPQPFEDGELKKWIMTHKGQFEGMRGVHFAILIKSGEIPSLDTNSQLIGAISLEINQEHPTGARYTRLCKRGKLGYWLGKDYWNKGYATEAVKAVIGYGFEKLRLNRIYAGHFTRNPASGRVMEKAGMTCEGLGREYVLHWGVYEDMVEYAILRKDYRNR